MALIQRQRGGWILAGLVAAVLAFPCPKGFAVVGQAEEFDRFKSEDLEEFQKNLTAEEKKEQDSRAAAMAELLESKEKSLQPRNAAPEGKEKKEIMNLKQELLNLKKRKRIQFEADGKYQYDTNVDRRPLNEEKSNSTYDANSAALFDLSGKKTDLRFEVRGEKEWNEPQAIKDFWGIEERIRYRRKYLKKILHTIQSRIARNSSKTVEINERKIRWDSQQNTSFNYSFSPKLALNSEFQVTHRYFSTKPFKRDSSHEEMMAPSAFFNVTPKSRIALGYRLATTSIRSKAGNANAHEIHAGYFGQITRKSSMSFDLAFSHQTPKALETPTVNSVTTGIGYIWQMTPKTQGTIQLIRSQQNSTSQSVNGNDNQVIKTDTHFTNESISLSLNSRLTAKLTAIMNFNFSHLTTHVAKGADKSPETMQIAFPFSFTINYLLSRWITLNFGYTFSYRVGNERADYFRSHLLQTGIRIIV